MPSEKAIQTSTRKKVVVHYLDGSMLKGYVESGSFLVPRGAEILDREGHLATIPLESVKGIYFVRDFEGHDKRQERKVFSSRPRITGIWIRMAFKDNEVMEGLLSNDLLAVDASGFMVTPPDFYSNNLRVFVPKSALGAVEALGVISDESARRAAQRTRRRPAKPAAESPQIGLFPESPPK
jgi:hypothetical protein